MDRKSIAIIVVVAIAVAAASYMAMEMDDTKEIGTDADGYKVSLSLSLQSGLKCYIGDKEYFDGDTIVFYDDKVLKIFAPSVGTIKCDGSWSDPEGTSTSGGSFEEYAAQMDYDLTWTAYFGDMSGSIAVTFVEGDPAN